MILRRARYRTVPWANGGGITHDIMVGGNPPLLRVSLAEIARDGPFSDLAGYDRTIVLAGGAGFRLTFADGNSVVLGALGDRHDFRGEDAPACALLDGPVFAFNVMVLRGAMRAIVDVIDAGTNVVWDEAPGTALFVLDGAVRYGAGMARRFDTVVLDAGRVPVREAPATLVAVRFSTETPGRRP